TSAPMTTATAAAATNVAAAVATSTRTDRDAGRRSRTGPVPSPPPTAPGRGTGGSTTCADGAAPVGSPDRTIVSSRTCTTPEVEAPLGSARGWGSPTPGGAGSTPVGPAGCPEGASPVETGAAGVDAAVVDAAGPPGSSGPPPRGIAPSATCLPALPGNERSRSSGAARDPRVHTSRSRPEEAIPHRRRVDRGATNAPSHRFGHVPWCRDHRG